MHVHIFLGEGIPALNRAQGAGAPELLQVVLDEVTGREENHGNLSTYSFERSTTPLDKTLKIDAWEDDSFLGDFRSFSGEYSSQI